MANIFTEDDAKRIGDAVGVDWTEIPVEEFLMGLHVELEHGTKLGDKTNVTDDDETVTGKIAHAHLLEFPDYYTRHEKMEQEAEIFWENRSRKIADQN